MATFTSKSAVETHAFGRSFAARLEPSAIVALVGDLGTGKTEFVKGVVAGLNTDAAATSPTFTLIHEYPGGRLPVFHFDLYRITTSQELDRLGIDEYFASDGVCLVEWADRFRDVIPARAEWIEFRETSENVREICVREIK